jgi:hypothetical protein
MLNGDRAMVRQWIDLVQEPIRNLMIFHTIKFSCFTSRDVTLFNIENLVLKANSEFNGLGGTDASCFGVLEQINCGFRNADCGIRNKSFLRALIISIRNPRSPIRNVKTPADFCTKERPLKPHS